MPRASVSNDTSVKLGCLRSVRTAKRASGMRSDMPYLDVWIHSDRCQRPRWSAHLAALTSGTRIALQFAAQPDRKYSRAERKSVTHAGRDGDAEEMRV